MAKEEKEVRCDACNGKYTESELIECETCGDKFCPDCIEEHSENCEG